MAQEKMTRRELVGALGGAALGAALRGGIAAEAEGKSLTFGVFADPQYGERDATIGRFYRDSPEKLAACIKTFAEAKPAFVIGLGDFVDGTSKDAETEMGHLKKIEGIFRGFSGPRYHVLGNHDLDAFS
ncbi:MAG: hypothetical protein FJ291_19000, partial [Planctomycetes bacterium]|nr:hypothetical protein [Planctomycetota bacterium]